MILKLRQGIPDRQTVETRPFVLCVGSGRALRGKMKKVSVSKDNRSGVQANSAMILGIWVDRPEMVMMTAKM